ncbi:MAG: hypothetical protein ACI8PZ_006854 [Myxococcota bacterium]|jgi:hypothetical protein
MSDDRMESGGFGFLLYLAPLLMIVVVFSLYAYMLYYGFLGRAATGDTVTVTIETCPEALATVSARLATMGLPHELTPTATGLEVIATLPEDDAVAQAIPSTLVRPGRFEVQDGEQGGPVLLGPEAVIGALIRLDMSMVPRASVQIDLEVAKRVRKVQQQTPSGALSFWLDGERVGGLSNMAVLSEPEIEVVPTSKDDKDQMERAARYALMIDDPLPCPARLVSVTVVEAAL